MWVFFFYLFFFPKWILALPVAITALAAACHSWLGTCQVSHKFKTYSPPPTPLHTCAKMILPGEFNMRPLPHTVGWQVSFPRCYSPKGGLITTLLCTMKYNYFIANQFQKCLSYSEAVTLLGLHLRQEDFKLMCLPELLQVDDLRGIGFAFLLL